MMRSADPHRSAEAKAAGPRAGGPRRDSQDFGYWGDPRYPSPRRLRTVLAFVIDLLIALGAGAGTFVATKHLAGQPALLYALAGVLAASFANRVLLSRLWQASVGKLLFGLRIIRGWDGKQPHIGYLIKAWLLSVWCVIAFVLDAPGDMAPDFNSFPAAIRRCDQRSPQQSTWPTGNPSGW